MASTFELITDYVAGSDVSVIDFENVTQAYEHLQLRISARSSYGGVSDDCRISFNRSTTLGTWDQQYIHGMYTTAGVGEIFSTYGQVWMGRLAGNTASASLRGAIYITVSDYANTSKKASLQWMGGNVHATQADQDKIISWGGASWSETTAIDEIRIQSGSSGIKAGSIVAIYGLKSS